MKIIFIALLSLVLGFAIGFLVASLLDKGGHRSTNNASTNRDWNDPEDAFVSRALGSIPTDATSKNLVMAALNGDRDAARLLSPLYGKISPGYAAFWERIGAENADSVSQYNYGLRLLESDKSVYGRSRATFWLRKAADRGDIDARERLEEIGEK